MIVEILTLLIVTAVLYGVAVGNWPYLAVNRTSITLIGSAALFAIGGITPHDAWRAIDFDTLAMLCGMMIINGHIESSGVYASLTHLAVTRIRHSSVLLACIMLISACASALFLNDTIVLVFTPLVISLARHTQTPPLPLLLGLAISANIGSAATITGNPQNMLIGTMSGIAFVPFMVAMLPVVTLSLIVGWGIIVIAYRRQLRPIPAPSFNMPMAPLSWHGVVIISGLCGAFLLGVPPVITVTCTMAILLIQRRPTTTSPFQHVDTSLLLFFAGLFIVTASFQASITAQSLYTTLTHTLDNNLTHLGIISTVLANVISNVPAVILLSPIVTQFEAPQAAWLMLSASATLAGNTTLLASVANLIVAERAAQHGVALPFGAYLRIGFPVTILSIGIALALLG